MCVCVCVEDLDINANVPDTQQGHNTLGYEGNLLNIFLVRPGNHHPSYM